MRYVGILIFLFFLTSCSATWESKFLTPTPVDGALSVELYDWETELYGGPSFGYVRPEACGYKLGKAYYFVYPRETSSSGTMGPPLIPFGLSTPETSNDRDALFVLRLFDPNNLYKVTPVKMSLFNGDNLLTSCKLTKSSQNAVGIEYKCSKEQAFPDNQPTKMFIEFSNQYIAELPIKSMKVSGYSPLFSFNGPNPKPKVVIYENSGSITYPN